MSSENETHDVVVTRTFDAPQERVWRAWSDADLVMKWWGPQGFTSPLCRMDFREGGTTLVCMRSAEGWELYNNWTYRSIEPMDRIEFVQGFAKEDGTRVAPAELGLPPGIPEEVRHVVTLSPIDDAHDRADRPRIRLPERGDRRDLASWDGAGPRQDGGDRRRGLTVASRHLRRAAPSMKGGNRGRSTARDRSGPERPAG